MRDYSKFSPRFYTGETGRFLRNLSRDHLLVGGYVFTCPNANMLGLYYLPLPTLSHELAMEVELARVILADLSEVPSEGLGRAFEGVYARYDEPTETIFVTEMARHQLGEHLSRRDNRHKAVLKELEQWRKSPFFNDFLARYRDDFELADVIANKPLQRSLEAPSKPRAGAGAGAGTRAGTRVRERGAPPRGEDAPENRTEANPVPANGAQSGLIEAGSNLTRSAEEWTTVAGISPIAMRRWLGHLGTAHKWNPTPEQAVIHARELAVQGDAGAQTEVVDFSIGRNAKSLIPLVDVRARRNGLHRSSADESKEKREQLERDRLQKLKDGRAARGLAEFRDPHQHEKADAYETQLRLAEQNVRAGRKASA